MAATHRSLNIPLINGLAGLVSVVLVLTILIIGQPVIMPVALAILFTFVLTPVVKVLEKLGLGRVAAVCALVAVGTCCLASLLVMAGVQMNELFSNLPDYWELTNAYVSGMAGENTFRAKLWAQVQQFVEPQLASSEVQNVDSGASSVNWPGMGLLSSIPAVLVSLVAPLASLAAIVVLTIFMLIFREDIRNRFIGALGEARLLNTTRVMSEASERLSNYLFGLCAVNCGFSVVLALGLFATGVPYALVWGIVSFFFRFIPYLGSTLSMVLPTLTALLVQQNWLAAGGVVLLYCVLEFITGNFIEPNLFGNSVGMNPIALLIALMFWAWAWGPIGMAMAIPLTLIIVTLGRHLPCFSSLEKLAGNSDPLPKHVMMYQRLLADDTDEPKKMVLESMETRSLFHAMEDTLLKALQLAKFELRTRRIDGKDFDTVESRARDLVDQLLSADLKDTKAVEENPEDGGLLPTSAKGRLAVTLVDSDVAADSGARVAMSAAGSFQWQVVDDQNYPAVVAAVNTSPEVILIAGVPPSQIAQILRVCRLVRKVGFEGKIIVGYWRQRPISRQHKRMLAAAGADFVTHRIWTVSRLLSHLWDMGEELNDHPEKPSAIASEEELVKA